MVLYDNLPVYRAGYNLLLDLFKVIGNLPRDYRYTIGEDLRRQLMKILYDIYKAIEVVKEEGLFHFHEEPNPACPVGKNIHGILDGKLSEIQDAMENKMKSYTLLDIQKGIKEI